MKSLPLKMDTIFKGTKFSLLFRKKNNKIIVQKNENSTSFKTKFSTDFE